MAETQQPWETFKDAEVVAPPTQQGAAPTEGGQEGQQPPVQPSAPSEGAETRPTPSQDDSEAGQMPWQTYADADVMEMPSTGISERVARDTDTKLSRPSPRVRLNYDARDSTTFLGWNERFWRTATFNTLDGVTAAALYYTKDDLPEGTTYADVLDAVRRGYAAEPSTSAQIAGGLVPAGATAKLAMKIGSAATRAAVKNGMINGVLKWAGRQTGLARLGAASGIGGAAARGAGRVATGAAKAAAVGGATGAAYEAVRESVDQTLEGMAGGDFNKAEITQSLVEGAVVGALMTPILAGAGNTVGGVFKWVKNGVAPSSDTAAARTTQALLKMLKNEGERPQETLDRISGLITTFIKDRGRPPALAEIISPSKARGVGKIVSYHAGLDDVAEDLSERQIRTVISDFSKAINKGAPLKDTRVLEAQMDRLFNQVTMKFGNVDVPVSVHAMNVFSRNRDFISKMARNNDDAQSILNVIDAKENIAKFQTKAKDLKDIFDVAAAKTNVAELKDQIEEMIMQQTQGKVPPSQLAQLQMMHRRLKAAAQALEANVAETQKLRALNEFKPQLASMQKVLEDYSQNGLKIKLSSVDGLRQNASKMAHSGTDPFVQDSARAIREAVADMGANQVPLYGDVVKLWHRSRIVSDAQKMGADATAGKLSTANLETHIATGKLPGGSKALVPEDVRTGADIGARISLGRSAEKGPVGAYKEARTIAESPEIQRNLAVTSPNTAEDIVGAAKQTKQSIEGIRAATSSKSPSMLDQEISNAQRAIEAAATPRLGGAALASLATKLYSKFQFPRPVAKKLVEAMLDPNESERALRYVASRGIDVTNFVAAFVAAANDAQR